MGEAAETVEDEPQQGRVGIQLQGQGHHELRCTWPWNSLGLRRGLKQGREVDILTNI